MAESSAIRRPPSDKRCVHCGQTCDKLTRDHVFPDAWYPESTPESVQRWTVPACFTCNNRLSLIEKEVFVRLGLCVNPQKVAATGISRRVIRSFGIGTEGLEEDEARIRRALRDEVLRTAKPFTEEFRSHLLPGIGPHPETPAGQQLQIDIPADKLYEVSRKIVRGCEYWFSGGRIIDPPYQLDIHFAHDADVPDVVKIFSGFDATHFGPGFRVRRGSVHNDPLSAVYDAVIWDSLKFYATILPADQAPGT